MTEGNGWKEVFTVRTYLSGFFDDWGDGVNCCFDQTFNIWYEHLFSTKDLVVATGKPGEKQSHKIWKWYAYVSSQRMEFTYSRSKKQYGLLSRTAYEADCGRVFCYFQSVIQSGSLGIIRILLHLFIAITMDNQYRWPIISIHKHWIILDPDTRNICCGWDPETGWGTLEPGPWVGVLDLNPASLFLTLSWVPQADKSLVWNLGPTIPSLSWSQDFQQTGLRKFTARGTWCFCRPWNLLLCTPFLSGRRSMLHRDKETFPPAPRGDMGGGVETTAGREIDGWTEAKKWNAAVSLLGYPLVN